MSLLTRKISLTNLDKSSRQFWIAGIVRTQFMRMAKYNAEHWWIWEFTQDLNTKWIYFYIIVPLLCCFADCILLESTCKTLFRYSLTVILTWDHFFFAEGNLQYKTHNLLNIRYNNCNKVQSVGTAYLSPFWGLLTSMPKWFCTTLRTFFRHVWTNALNSIGTT